MKKPGVFFIVLLLMTTACISLKAATSEQFHTAFESMFEARIQPQRTLAVENVTISHQDVTFELISGSLAFFEPVVIDADSFFYAAFFKGKGNIRFEPPLKIEQEQLQRWYDSDSLNRPFEDMLLLFSPAIYKQLLHDCPESASPFSSGTSRKARRWRNKLTKDETYFYLFHTLTAQLGNLKRPFLLAGLEPHKSPRIHYWFNPNWREEIGLTRRLWRPGVHYQEWICKYSQFAEQEYPNLNGHSKARIRVSHTRTNGSIDRSGRYTGSAVLSLKTLRKFQTINLSLHYELVVDSILDADGNQLSFSRWKKRDNRSRALYLFLNNPLEPGQNTKLTFFYNGKIAERILGEFFVSASGDWYPRYNSMVTFDMTFRTPRLFAFLSTGTLLLADTLKDTIISRWKTSEPCRSATFTIGNMTRFPFGDSKSGPVDVYYHKDLHRNRNRQKHVGEDVVSSIKLFSHLFGEYPFAQTSVSEILATHAEAFPGFVHLGYDFWETDIWGTERLVRAHEVAHQWWGVSVNELTYHDMWLSEGFAEYSSLMYYQAAYGQDKFAKKLREYRDDIFSVRKYIFGSGAESGPVILGYRTSSSKTKGDYGLIVYEKGAYVLHMLRNLLLDLNTMSEDIFLQMMQQWYQQFKGKYATTADFQAHVERFAGIDMDWFFQQWVYGTDLPEYKFDYEIVEQTDGSFTANCTVITKDVPDDFKMYLPIEIKLKGNRRFYTRMLIDQPEMQFPVAGIPEHPEKLTLNPFESVLCKIKQ